MANRLLQAEAVVDAARRVYGRWIDMDSMDEADEAFQLAVDLDGSAKRFVEINRAKRRPGTDGYALWVTIARVFDFATEARETLVLLAGQIDGDEDA